MLFKSSKCKKANASASVLLFKFIEPLFVCCFLKDLLFLHQCTQYIITERTYKIKQIYKITNRTQSKQFITKKGSYILSYKF